MGWSDITMSSHNLNKSRISSLLGIHNIRQQLYDTYIAKCPGRCIVRSNHKVKLSSNSYLILKQPAQNNITQRWTKGESLGKRFSRNAFLENEKKSRCSRDSLRNQLCSVIGHVTRSSIWGKLGFFLCGLRRQGVIEEFSIQHFWDKRHIDNHKISNV